MYKVPGLKRGFRTRENQIIVGMWEYQKVFEKVLAGVWSVVEDQINRCVTKSIKVEYVVLIGGFGDSPALQRYLKLKLARTSKDLGYNIELIEIEAKDSAMAVACGAVLRGLDKDNGPQRHPVSSIGLLGDEQLDMSFPGHRYAWNNRRKHPKLASFSNVDGLAYVRACPEWVIKKVRASSNLRTDCVTNQFGRTTQSLFQLNSGPNRFLLCSSSGAMRPISSAWLSCTSWTARSQKTITQRAI